MTTLSLDAQENIIRKRLEVDERPLKRLARKLLLIAQSKNGSEVENAEIGLEFSQYEHILRRLSLLAKANVEEIHRHEGDAASLQFNQSAAHDEVRRLKDQLSMEQISRSNRAFYDSLTLDMREKAPRSRKMQSLSIVKLEEEVQELEMEKRTYSETWQLRKSAFEDIMSHLLVLQHEISGEKADAELRDAAEDSDDDEGVVVLNEQSHDQEKSDSAANSLEDTIPRTTSRGQEHDSTDEAEKEIDLMDTS